jgi:hypothetical protein
MDGMWELIFFLVILKIPVAYLCFVVWYAVRAKPEPGKGADPTLVAPPEPPAPWQYWLRRSRWPHGGPHESPLRTYARTARVSPLRAEGDSRR